MLKRRKTAGSDRITTKMIDNIGEIGLQIIHTLFILIDIKKNT